MAQHFEAFPQMAIDMHMTSRPSSEGKREGKMCQQGGQGKKLMTSLEVSIYWCCY
jgi:hypothetical protein